MPSFEILLWVGHLIRLKSSSGRVSDSKPEEANFSEIASEEN